MEHIEEQEQVYAQELAQELVHELLWWW